MSLDVIVMPAHSRLKNGVASLAYVAGICDLGASIQPQDVDARRGCKTRMQDVDGRNKSGQDGFWFRL